MMSPGDGEGPLQISNPKWQYVERVTKKSGVTT